MQTTVFLKENCKEKFKKRWKEEAKRARCKRH
jgi:hypothetical protein